MLDYKLQSSISVDHRRSRIRSLLNKSKCLRVIEAHSPISALIAQNTKQTTKTGQNVGYDAIWSSSLADSVLLGLPDIEILTPQVRAKNIVDMFDICDLPVIYDGDTGGPIAHLCLSIRALERLGVSMIVIEDKKGLKQNSLFGNEVSQQQESIEIFCQKLAAAKHATTSSDFLVAARCESLILDSSVQIALTRCCQYVEAGADAIMIHSRKSDGIEILEFARKFRESFAHIPLICAPTSYPHLKFSALEAAGFNIIIYANHMLRSAYLAMQCVSNSILREECSQEIESQCLSVPDLLSIVRSQYEVHVGHPLDSLSTKTS